MSYIKKLKLNQMNPTDADLQKLLISHPMLEQLELGSLRSITVVPSQFPDTLKSVVLHEVPEQLVSKFMDNLQAYPLEEIEIDAWPPKYQQSRMPQCQ